MRKSLKFEQKDLFINIVILAYVLIQLFFYILVTFIGVKDIGYLINYSSIALNFLFSIFLILIIRKKTTMIVVLALLFTLLADTGLIILEKWYSLSVFFFLIVQVLYALYLHSFNKRLSLKNDLFLRISLAFVVEVVAYGLIREKYDFLLFITLLYFTNFCINLILALLNSRQNVLFAMGLTLFILCDISLGLYNSRDYLNVSNNGIVMAIINCPIDLVWMFYYPSQVLIVLSMKYNRMVQND